MKTKKLEKDKMSKNVLAMYSLMNLLIVILNFCLLILLFKNFYNFSVGIMMLFIFFFGFGEVVFLTKFFKNVYKIIVYWNRLKGRGLSFFVLVVFEVYTIIDFTIYLVDQETELININPAGTLLLWFFSLIFLGLFIWGCLSLIEWLVYRARREND